MTTPNKEAEAGNILKLDVFPKDGGEPRDVSAGVILCSYYESVLEYSVRMVVVIVDTGFTFDGSLGRTITVLNDLKLSGTEKVHAILEDNYKNKLKFVGDQALYIKEIRNIITSSEKSIYTLDLVSKELIANDLLSCEVYRRFNGEISQSAESILKDILKTKKDISLDATKNKYNFAGSGKKPFRLLSEIATRGIPQTAKSTAGYLIFETYDGFNFRSIDTLFDRAEDYAYIHNSSTELPRGYFGKILRYDADTSIDVHKNLVSGGYGARLETFNIYTHLFERKKQEVETEDQKVHGGKRLPVISDEFLEYATEGAYYSRRFSQVDEIGHMPQGGTTEQIEKSTEQNLTLEEVIVQSAMTYNKLFTLHLEIIVPGNYNIRAGHIIKCDFPETTGKRITGFDKELSGLYIVADVCTQLTPKSILTKMHLVRDSYGRKGGGGSTNAPSQRNNIPSFDTTSDFGVTVDNSAFNNSNIDFTALNENVNFDPENYLGL